MPTALGRTTVPPRSGESSDTATSVALEPAAGSATPHLIERAHRTSSRDLCAARMNPIQRRASHPQLTPAHPRHSDTGGRVLPVTDGPSTRALDVLLRIAGNDRCVECDEPSPRWASVSFGTFFCLSCASTHRDLGVGVSFVRSITMDRFTPTQLATLKVRARRFSCAACAVAVSLPLSTFSLISSL